MARLSDGFNSVPFAFQEGDLVEDAFTHASFCFGFDPTDNYLIVVDNQIREMDFPLLEESDVVFVMIDLTEDIAV